jgi:HlyD family secretion protein
MLNGATMDRPLPHRRWTRGRIAAVVVGLAVLAGAGATMVRSSGRQLRVPAADLSIAPVQRRAFQEYIFLTGNVLPSAWVYLDAVEGGRVEEVYAREGATVKQGQPLLRLSNNDLELRLIAAETQRVEQTTQLQDTRLRLEQNARELRQQLAQADFEIGRLEREAARNGELYRRGLLSRAEHEASEAELEYNRRRRAQIADGVRQEAERAGDRIAQMESSLTRMQANYQVVQRIMHGLVVRSPVAGQLTGLEVQVGEIRTAGSRFGQVDVLDGYKARAEIDEFYISRIAPGQSAATTGADGADYRMRVARVYPQVRNGRFQVDLEFTGSVPAALRRGQTLRLRLELGATQQATVVPRGAFYRHTGGNWIYVVEGNRARRREIRLGRQNPDYFEVLGGLAPGDRVVVSAYDAFGDADVLVWN